MTTLRYQYSIDDEGVIRLFRGTDVVPVGLANVSKMLQSSGIGPFGVSERDLMKVMASILYVDRLSPRKSLRGARVKRMLSWQREISLTIAVEQPERWLSAVDLIVDLLVFMTDDDWSLTFTQVGHSSTQQLPFFQNELLPSEVALFSGGLDSSAGLLARGLKQNGPLVAVSACGNAVRSYAQCNAMQYLRNLGIDVHWVKFEHQLRQTKRPRRHMEATQRSRSLLFLAMGAAVASFFELSSFSVFETGVGCINLPLSRAQVASQNTRALHPRTLLMFNRLVSHIFERPMRVVAPFFFLTKGQLCQEVKSALAEIAARASSCDEGEGNKANPMEHCGLCTSCLFRRTAIFSAMGSADPTPYRDKITRQHDAYELKMLEGHIADLSQVHVFEDLISVDPDLRFVLPYLSDLPGPDVRTQVVELYRRYAFETAVFLDQARPEITDHLRRVLSLKERNYDLFATAR